LLKKNLKRAKELILELKVVEAWESVHATANLIGSVKSGLLMNNLDIDFHVYSRDFSLEDSFKAIGRIAAHPGIGKVSFYNFLSQEDRSLDWHLHFVDTDQRRWKIDIIHLMNDSPYAGKFERVTARIMAALTPELKKIILKIKWEGSRQGVTMMGAEVYKAVLRDHVASLEGFLAWKAAQAEEHIILWEPD